MHIPDGFLAPQVFTPLWVAGAGGLAYALRKARQALKEKAVPLMGVTAAFIFAAQMLNFPIIGGTSGHLLGGVLAAVLLGPYAGAIVISLVLIVQCLVFQDGGLTALGANIFNMAFLGSLGDLGMGALSSRPLDVGQGSRLDLDSWRCFCSSLGYVGLFRRILLLETLVDLRLAVEFLLVRKLLLVVRLYAVLEWRGILSDLSGVCTRER